MLAHALPLGLLFGMSKGRHPRAWPGLRLVPARSVVLALCWSSVLVLVLVLGCASPGSWAWAWVLLPRRPKPTYHCTGPFNMGPLETAPVEAKDDGDASSAAIFLTPVAGAFAECPEPEGLDGFVDARGRTRIALSRV